MRPILIASLILPLLGCGDEISVRITVSPGLPDDSAFTWRISYTSDADADFHLQAVWGSSDANVYAVGSHGTILRFNGSTWRAIRPPGDYLGLYHDVDGTSAADVWVVGSGRALHFNGATWREFDIAGARSLFTVCALRRNDAIAGGEDGKLYRFDGRRWREFGDVGIQNVIDVWARAGDDIWAVTVPAIHHFDGRQWTKVIEDARYQFDSACRQGDRMLLAGWSGSAATGNGALFAYEDDALASMPVRNPMRDFIGFDALEPGPDGAMWAGGANGTMFRLDAGDAVWQREHPDTELDIQDLWVAPSGRVYAVGGRRGIVRAR